MWFGRRKSKQQAKERLQLVLSYDRIALGPGELEQLKKDLLLVLLNYFPVDSEAVEVLLDQAGEKVTLTAMIPVKS